MFLRNLILIFSAMLFVAGCEQTNDNPSDFKASIVTMNLDGLMSTSFAEREGIRIILAIQNTSSESKTISFTSGQQYDFVIKDDNGDEIWRWSDDKVFIASLTSYDLAPNEIQTFTYTWNQVLSDGKTLIPVGSYTLQADSLGIDVKQPSQELNITADTTSDSDFDVTIKSTDSDGQDTDTFVQGEEINIQLAITNISAETKTLSFPSTEQHDCVIRDSDGDEVWRWTSTLQYIMEPDTLPSSYDLAPTETKTFVCTWNPMVSETLPVGDNTLEADSFGLDVKPTQDLHITSAENPAPDFDVSLKTTDKFDQTSTSFVQGEEINLILSITNISSETQTLEFTSTRQYDFVIRNTEGTEVWRWSNGAGDMLTSYDLAPDETRVFEVTWDQMLSDGVSVIPVGDYTLAADRFGINVKVSQNLTIQ